MVNPGSFLGSRGDFIKAQTTLYAEAVRDSHIADTVADIQRRYLKRFPVTLREDEEPSEEWLAQVDDEAADEEVYPPDASSLEKDAADKALAEYTDLVARIKFKKEQIKRRLQYIYSKSHDADSSFDKAIKDPISSIASKLLGVELKLPRRKTPYNVWGPKNRTAVDPIFNKRVKETEARKDQHAALRSAVYKELFEQLPPAEQQKWSQIAEREHEKIVADAKKKFKNSIPTTPEARQRVITALPKFIEPILDAVCDYTGWKASFIVGGPEPADGGRLNMISIHSGLTKGSTKMDFGRSQKSAYKHHIVPAFGSFLKKCYSVQDCRDSALPQDHSCISINDVAEDEEVTMQVHTFESDAEQENAHKPRRPFDDIAKSGKSTKHSRPPTGTPSPTPRFGPPIGKKKARILPFKDAALVKLGPSPLSQSFIPPAVDATSSPDPTTSAAAKAANEKETDPSTSSVKTTEVGKALDTGSSPSTFPGTITSAANQLSEHTVAATLPIATSAASEPVDGTTAPSTSTVETMDLPIGIDADDTPSTPLVTKTSTVNSFGVDATALTQFAKATHTADEPISNAVTPSTSTETTAAVATGLSTPSSPASTASGAANTFGIDITALNPFANTTDEPICNGAAPSTSTPAAKTTDAATELSTLLNQPATTGSVVNAFNIDASASVSALTSLAKTTKAANEPVRNTAASLTSTANTNDVAAELGVPSHPSAATAKSADDFNFDAADTAGIVSI